MKLISSLLTPELVTLRTRVENIRMKFMFTGRIKVFTEIQVKKIKIPNGVCRLGVAPTLCWHWCGVRPVSMKFYGKFHGLNIINFADMLRREKKRVS